MSGGLKLAAIAIGAIIAFLLIGSIVHVIVSALVTVAIAAAIVGGVVIAIKVARSNRQVNRGRGDDQIRESYSKPLPRADLDQYAAPQAPRQAPKPTDIEDELSRLKREMGS